MAGESECATGSPRMAKTRVRAVDHRTVPATRLTTAPISSCSSAKVCAVARRDRTPYGSLTSVRPSLAAGVLAEQVRLVLAAQLGDPRQVVAATW